MNDRYYNAGYSRGEIPLGERLAVLSVDLQAGFLSGQLQIGQSPHVQEAVGSAKNLLRSARACGIPVFHTFVEWREDAADLGLWKYKIPCLSQFVDGSGFECIDARVLGAGDITLAKRKPSAFFGTGLDAILREASVDSVVICGVTTSGCVRASVVDAFSYGFKTVVASDACGDQDLSAHEANLADIARRYANVWSVKEICERAFRPATKAPA